MNYDDTPLEMHCTLSSLGPEQVPLADLGALNEAVADALDSWPAGDSIFDAEHSVTSHPAWSPVAAVLTIAGAALLASSLLATAGLPF